MLYTQISSRTTLVLPAVSALIFAYIIEVLVLDGQTRAGLILHCVGFNIFVVLFYVVLQSYVHSLCLRAHHR